MGFLLLSYPAARSPSGPYLERGQTGVRAWVGLRSEQGMVSRPRPAEPSPCRSSPPRLQILPPCRRLGPMPAPARAAPPNSRHGRHADGLCPGDRRRVPALRPGPGPGAAAGTDHASQPAAPDGRITARQMEVLSGRGHAGAGRRSAGRLLAPAALGQLRHGGARRAQLARPGRGAQALVPLPRAADRRHPPGAGGDRRQRGHRDRRAGGPGATDGQARVLPGERAAQHPRAGLLVHRLAHSAAGRALSRSPRRRMPMRSR